MYARDIIIIIPCEVDTPGFYTDRKVNNFTLVSIPCLQNPLSLVKPISKRMLKCAQIYLQKTQNSSLLIVSLRCVSVTENSHIFYFQMLQQKHEITFCVKK